MTAKFAFSNICPKRFSPKLQRLLQHLNCKALAPPASFPRLPAHKFSAFLLIALLLSGAASAQTLPRLSVTASENNVLEGHNITLTFRLNRVTDDRLEYCFMAGGSASDSLVWEFEPARPANEGYAEISGYIEAGQREDVVTIRTQDDGTDDPGEQQILLQYSIADTFGAVTCTQNYTVEANQSGGTLRVYDAHDYYSSVDISVSAGSTSISEGATAEFVLTRSGGLISQGTLVVEADDVDMDVKFKIGETGYVFPSNFAPWRVKGDANYREISTDPANGETAVVTMPAGDTEVTLEVDTNNDAVPEIANTAISVTVLSGDRPYSISTPTASTTVEDIGDTPSVRIHGPVTDTQVSEAAGHLLFGVQHSISHAPVDLTLRLSTSGDFFGATPSVELGVYRSATQPFLQAVSVTPRVLPSGELEFTLPFEEFDADSVTRMVRVAIVNDDVDEADGSATLTIPAQQGAASVSSTVSVTDDDLPIVTLEAGSHLIAEGGSVVFTLTRDGNTAVALSIPQQYLTSSFTPSRTVQDAEYPIEFSAGSNTATFTVSSANDDVFYTARRLVVTLDPDANAQFRVPDRPPSGSESGSGADFTQYILLANDNDKAKLSMSAVTSPVDEADQACFVINVESTEFHPTIAWVFDVVMTVTEEGSYLASTQDRSFRYGITQLGPIESNDPDYDVCLTLDDDLVDEPAGTVSVEVTGPSNAHVEPATNAKASVAVQDNDDPTFTASLSVTEVHEDAPTDVTLHRAGVLDDSLTVQAGDFKIEYVYPPEASKQPVVLLENAVTFAASADTAVSQILLPLDNSYDPGRQLQVTVNANGGSYRVPSTLPANAVADLSDATKTVYRYPIVEDDPAELGIQAVTQTVDESQQACYRLYLNGYIVSPFTATIVITGGSNYLDSQQETVLSVYASALPHEFCIDLDDDDVAEAEASISASIHSVSDTDIQTLSGNPAASVLVQDNEILQEVWIESVSAGIEGENVTFELTRSGTSVQIGEELSVSYKFEQVRNSFVPIIGTGNRTAVFAADATSATLTASTSDNDYVNATVAIRLRLLESDSFAYAFSADVDKPSAVEFDIANDDEYSVFVELATNQSSTIEEGESIELDLKRCILQDDGTVDCTNPLSIDGADSISEDLPLYITVDGNFFGTLPSTVHFGDFEQSATLTIDTIDDLIDELDGSITIKTVDPDSGRADQSVEITVEDNDTPPPPTVWIGNIQPPVEGENVTFELTRSGTSVQIGEELSVSYKFEQVRNSFVPIIGTGNRTAVFAADATSATLTASTSDNDYVNAAVAIRLRLLESDSLAYAFSADVDKPSAVEFDIANDDEYSVFVELATNQSSMIEEGESIELDLKRCILQDDGTVDCTNPLSIDGADAISEDLPLYITVDGNFFGTLPSTVHFGNFEQSATLTIDSIGDDIHEADGSIEIRTVDPDSGRADQSVTVTVEDDDRVQMEFSMPERVTEGDTVTITLTRSKSEIYAAVDVRADIEYHTKMFARGNRPDVIRILAFAVDETSKTISMTTDGDAVNEGDGKIEVSFSRPAAYEFPLRRGWTRVVDDDVPEVTLSVSATEVVEGDTVTWTLSRSDYVQRVLQVLPHYEWRHFFPPPDRDRHLSGEQTTFSDLNYAYGFISAGDTSNTWDECSFGLTGCNMGDVVGPLGGFMQRRIKPFPQDAFVGIPTETDTTFLPRYTVSNPDWVRVTIYNSAPSVTLQMDQEEVDEGESVSFTLNRLGGRPLALNSEMRINVDVSQVGDYLSSGEGTTVVTFPLNTTTTQFTLETVADVIYEEDGSITATLLPGALTGLTEDEYEFDTNVRDDGSYPHTGTTAVKSDDLEPVLSVEDASALESDGDMEFTVTLDRDAGQHVLVSYITTSYATDAAQLYHDFIPKTGSLTFQPGQTSKTVSVVIEDDNLFEDDETFTFLLSGPFFAKLGRDRATGTIVDDDTPKVTMAVASQSVAESDATLDVCATLTPVSTQPVLVTVTSFDGTASSVTDYTAIPASTKLTFPVSNKRQCQTIAITPDFLDESDETFTVTLSDVENADLGTQASTTVTIVDDDTRGVSVSTTTLDVEEGYDAGYTVVLTSRPTADVTVTPSRASGDTDVTVSGALTFTPLNWSTAQTVTVGAAQDADALDDAAVIGHAVSGGGDYAGVTAASVDVAVDDDETTSSGVTLSVDPDSIGEAAAATTITVTAALNSGTRGSRTPVVVSVGSGTATLGTDFEAAPGITFGLSPTRDTAFTITIPANAASQTGIFILTPTQDTMDEPNETVSVNGTTTVPGFSVTGAEVTITDDDAAPTVTLSLSDDSISEDGGIATVAASLDRSSSVATTVTVGRVAGYPGHVLGLLPEHEPGIDDSRERHQQHGHGDDRGRGQRYRRRGQDRAGEGRRGQPPGGDGSFGCATDP